jgi:DNA polymerase-1
MEIRCLANYCHDPALLEAIEREDIHQAVSAWLFDVDYDDVTEKQRDKGKKLNFAILYGMGGESLAMRLGIQPGEVTDTHIEHGHRGRVKVSGLVDDQPFSTTIPESVVVQDGERAVLLRERGFNEANALIDTYFDRFPLVKRWIEAQREMASKVGLVVSGIGRVRRLGAAPYLSGGQLQHCLRQAVNSPIQGLAADITNMTLSRVTVEISGYKDWWWICNTVHDSILLECREEMAAYMSTQLIECMTQQPYPGFDIPLKVDVDITKRWGGELEIDKLLEDDDGDD